MTKHYLKSSLVVGLALVCSVALADLPANGTSNDPDTCFTSATGTVGNISIPNRFEVRWGYQSKNILKFVPQTFTATDNSSFRVGQLSWFNSIYKDTNGKMDTNLQIGMDFGARGSGLMALDLKYQEDKSTSGRNDKFTLPTDAKFGTAIVDGKLYNVKLAGFKHNNGAGQLSGNTWSNKEMQWDTIDVYAKLEPNPVPEPATMAALGLGIAALARRRRNRK